MESVLSSDALVAANNTAFDRVYVASDFSTNAAAVGAVVYNPNLKAAAAAPVAPAGSIATFDGSVIAGTISGLTAHSWTADANGLFHTTDLSAEWKADEATMLAGHADTLTPLQRMEGNAEAVIDNTAAATRFNATQLQALCEDAQREFDAIDAAQRINQVQYGIDPALEWNSYTYLKMEETLQGNEQLKELGYQGHGVNGPPRYNGFTTDFQNKTDAILGV